MEYEVVKLEDNKEYLILKEEVIDDIKYLYLLDTNDEDNYAIRKEIDDEFVGLSEDEFNKITQILLKDAENMF